MPIATTTRTGTTVINAGEVFQKYWISRDDFYADPNPLLRLERMPAICIQGMPHVLVHFHQVALPPGAPGLSFTVWGTTTTGNAGAAPWAAFLTDWVQITAVNIIPIGTPIFSNLHLPGFASIMVVINAQLVGGVCPSKDSLLYCCLGAAAT